jgi:hypothetical protein
MPRSRPNIQSNRRTHSIANPTVYSGADDLLPPEKRVGQTGYGKQGEAVCPVCGATERLRLLASEAITEFGQSPKDVVLAQHRIGGGRFNPKRGADVRCGGSLTQPQ